MFDIFGMDKANTKEAIQEIAAGVTRGMINAYQFELEDKQREIDNLKQKLQEREDYKKRYDELIAVLDYKKEREEEKKAFENKDNENKQEKEIKTSENKENEGKHNFFGRLMGANK